MVIKLIVGRKKDFCVGNLYLETNSMTFDVYIVRCVIDRIIVVHCFSSLSWINIIRSCGKDQVSRGRIVMEWVFGI